MLKAFKLGINSMWSENFQMFKLDLEKAEEPEMNLPVSTGSYKKQKNSRKNLLLLHWLCYNLWLCRSQQSGKFLKRWECQTTLHASCVTCRSRSNMEQWTGSKLVKEYSKAILSHCLFNLYAEYIMQNARLDEAQARIKVVGEISTNSDMQMKRNKSL